MTVKNEISDFFSNYVFKKNLYYFLFGFIFLFGMFYATLLKDEFYTNTLNLSFFSLFSHNIFIALPMSLTIYISIPILLLNFFNLGMAIMLSFKYIGAANSIPLMIHIPFEVLGWMLTFSISLYIHSIIIKKSDKISTKKIISIYVLLIFIYLFSALIEINILP